uniref:Uncharacterized protein n=1 Tax=Kalanchoe fedtschenkoi TaxID=63787 RepID=A0A7N0UN90_KALFE
MMEHRCIKAPKAGQKKSLNISSNDAGERVTLEYSQSKSSGSISSTCAECQLTVSIKKHQRSDKISKELVPGHYSSDCRISKRITSPDEQYLSHCLELIQISAAKAASFNISVTWSPSKNSYSTDSLPLQRNVSIVGSLLPDAVSPSKNWIVGSGTRRKTMIDTLRSPLFRHGTADNDTYFEANSLASIKASLDSHHFGSLDGFSLCSSPMAEKETPKQMCGQRSQYMSSTTSTFSDLSFCPWTAMSHGTLQCTWSNGIPHFMFSMDNERDVYVTRPSKCASSDGTSLDWTYFFHLSASGSNRKDFDFRRSESDMVGRMNVSAPRYTLRADNSKIMETEFVLYGDNEHLEEELESLSYDMGGKHRMLPGKVSKFFKPLHLPKHRPNTSIWGTSTSLDFSPSKSEQVQDDDCDLDHTGRPNLSKGNIPSNFELAAIVVTEQIQVPQQETEVSGWGLSFLKKTKEKQAIINCQSAQAFSNLGRPSKLEASMDILVPAGYHGGPKTRNGGPSNLIERWRSGGQCDCGGWDSGCPLTVLNIRSNTEELNPASQSKGVDKCFYLFPKGDEGRAPTIKIANIQKGLYYIDFQSKLSALQCFSIAVAVIHNTNPTLRPKSQIC